MITANDFKSFKPHKEVKMNPKPRADVFFKAADLAEEAPGCGACLYLDAVGPETEEITLFRRYFKDGLGMYWLGHLGSECCISTKRGNLVRQLALQFMGEMIKSGCAPENPEVGSD